MNTPADTAAHIAVRALSERGVTAYRDTDADAGFSWLLISADRDNVGFPPMDRPPTCCSTSTPPTATRRCGWIARSPAPETTGTSYTETAPEPRSASWTGLSSTWTIASRPSLTGSRAAADTADGLSAVSLPVRALPSLLTAGPPLPHRGGPTRPREAVMNPVTHQLGLTDGQVAQYNLNAQVHGQDTDYDGDWVAPGVEVASVIVTAQLSRGDDGKVRLRISADIDEVPAGLFDEGGRVAMELLVNGELEWGH